MAIGISDALTDRALSTETKILSYRKMGSEYSIRNK